MGRLGLIAALVLTCHTAAAQPVRYMLDEKVASIGFETESLGLVSAFGRFARFTGTLMLDPTDPAQTAVAVTVDDEAITTPLGIGTERLRSAAYFDAARFPTIAFHSVSALQPGPGQVQIEGMLTIRGITHNFTLTARLRPGDGGVAEVVARGTLSRAAYGMVADRGLFSDTVILTIRTRIVLPAASPLLAAP